MMHHKLPLNINYIFLYIYYNVLLLMYYFHIDCILQCIFQYVDEGLGED